MLYGMLLTILLWQNEFTIDFEAKVGKEIHVSSRKKSDF